jgi:hypothetical protein
MMQAKPGLIRVVYSIRNLLFNMADLLEPTPDSLSQAVGWPAPGKFRGNIVNEYLS